MTRKYAPVLCVAKNFWGKPPSPLGNKATYTNSIHYNTLHSQKSKANKATYYNITFTHGVKSDEANTGASPCTPIKLTSKYKMLYPCNNLNSYFDKKATYPIEH